MENKNHQNVEVEKLSKDERKMMFLDCNMYIVPPLHLVLCSNIKPTTILYKGQTYHYLVQEHHRYR